MTGLRFRFDPARMSGEHVLRQAETAVAPVDAMSHGRRVVEEEAAEVAEVAEVADDETPAGDSPEDIGDIDSEPSGDGTDSSAPDAPESDSDSAEDDSGDGGDAQDNEPENAPAPITIPEGADIEAMSAVELKVILDANGISYDGRWGADKLRTLLVPAETVE